MVVDLTVSPPTVPDLVGSLSISPLEVKAGEEVSLGYGVINGGNRTAGGFTCSLVIDNLVVSSTRVDSIGVGETVSFEYVFSPSRSGTYPVSYAVDVDDDVAETDEGNNLAVGSVGSVDPFNYGFLTAGLFLIVVTGYYLVSNGVGEYVADTITNAIKVFFEANELSFKWYKHGKHIKNEIPVISKEQFRKILNQTGNPKVKSHLYFTKDTGLRISDLAALPIRVKPYIRVKGNTAQGTRAPAH